MSQSAPAPSAVFPRPAAPGDSAAGFAYGLTAYGLWGIVPLYFRQLETVPAVELLAHRIVWSVLFLSVLLSAIRRWADVRAVLGSAPRMRLLAVSTLLIGGNWLLYTHAAVTRQVVEAALGYFISPLASVALGVVVLGERLRAGQVIGLVLAAAGVAAMTWLTGRPPWIAVGLAGSFSLYGLVRKQVPADGLTGLAVETLLLFPLSLGVLVWWGAQGAGAFGRDVTVDLWLTVSGVVTCVPLMCFGQAARKLRLSTLGFLQYLSPTIAFALAVTVLGEPFSGERLPAFALIWTALAVYTADTWRAMARASAAAARG